MKLSSLLPLGALLLSHYLFAAEANKPDELAVSRLVAEAVLPVQQQYQIPGLGVGIVVEGRHYEYYYGVASKTDKKPVTGTTLFEVGSVSKTLTASLAAVAQAGQQLALTDKVSDHITELQGTKFGDVALLHLATHTAGGLPLQVPSAINTQQQLIAYLKAWQPTYGQGHYRTYSNLGIGLLGVIVAKRMKGDFSALMQQHIFSPLGMNNTYYTVPTARMADYAQGYSNKDVPSRLAAGMLGEEAYGVKTTVADLIRFAQGNMAQLNLAPALQQGLENTHIGYFNAGPMDQSLIWERYQYPLDMAQVIDGSGKHMAFEAKPATKLSPLQSAPTGVLIQKTGSTRGFGAYIYPKSLEMQLGGK